MVPDFPRKVPLDFPITPREMPGRSAIIGRLAVLESGSPETGGTTPTRGDHRMKRPSGFIALLLLSVLLSALPTRDGAGIFDNVLDPTGEGEGQG